MKTYVFACIHNAGRSQMAAALFNRHATSAECRAISAGTQPALRVHPEVVAVMQEIGIDLTAAKPQLLTEELVKDASALITMGCGEACPFVPGLRTMDWNISDPKGQSVDRVRAIRDEIRERIERLRRSESC